MAAVVITSRVIWHHEVGGKKVLEDQIDVVQSAGDPASIKAVLVANTRQKGTTFTTIVIDSIINVDPAGVIA